MSHALKKPLIKAIKKIEGVLTPAEMIRFVRKNSPFYKKLYESMPDTIALKDLPPTSPEEFWKANSLPHGQVQTGPIQDGFIFSSGGTTGTPKFTVYSKQEWQIMTQAFGNANSKGYMESGDKIANLFYVGGMYGSFVFTTRFLEYSTLDLLQLPIAGHTDHPTVLKILKEFKANVIVGVPFSLMNLVEYVAKNPGSFDVHQIKKIFYAGEPIFGDQKDRIEQTFPQAKIHSIGYACIDSGIVGYFDSTCSLGEHRVFGDHTVIEIVDESTGKVIEEAGQEGMIVLTSLYRTLMPIVKFPVGDRGVWTEPKENPDRKFRLLGRAGEAARIGSVKFYITDIRSLLDPYRTSLDIIDFQMTLIHRDKKDCLILKIASRQNKSQLQMHSQKIITEFERIHPLYVEMRDNSGIHALEIQWVSPSELEINKRTGKIIRVFDKRNP